MTEVDLMPDSILDDLFLSCALTAFLERAHAEKGWPDSDATRRLAYRVYEEALAEKNAPNTSIPDDANGKV
jgi:hypothetical protein